MDIPWRVHIGFEIEKFKTVFDGTPVHRIKSGHWSLARQCHQVYTLKYTLTGTIETKRISAISLIILILTNNYWDIDAVCYVACVVVLAVVVLAVVGGDDGGGSGV